MFLKNITVLEKKALWVIGKK